MSIFKRTKKPQPTWEEQMAANIAAQEQRIKEESTLCKCGDARRNHVLGSDQLAGCWVILEHKDGSETKCPCPRFEEA